MQTSSCTLLVTISDGMDCIMLTWMNEEIYACGKPVLSVTRSHSAKFLMNQHLISLMA
jgi:hypothetical protein